MKYREFGKTGVKVSEIGFGGASISGEGRGYGFGGISEDDSIALLKEAFDRGINLFDTAPIYGFRTSEIRMGKAFKNMRDKVFLVSKCGIDWHENKRVDMNNSPEVTQKMLEQSLRDLQTEYIDLYMVHWPDERVDIRKTVEVLEKAQREQKIKYIGLCNTNESEIKLAKEVATIDAFQSEFCLTNQVARDNLFPFIGESAFMSWGTFDKGILTGRVTKGRKYDDDDCRKWASWWKEKDILEKLEKVDKLNEYLKDKDYSLINCALGFNLSFKNLSTALCGVRSSEQLDSLIKAYENLPSSSDIEQFREFFL